MSGKDYFSVCNTLAVTSYKTALDVCPEVSRISPSTWDFFVSILAFYVSTLKIKNSGLSQREQETVFSGNCKEFVKKYPDFMRGLEHLMTTAKRDNNDELSQREQLGFWLATNLFNKNSTNLLKEEFQIGLNITDLVVQSL